MKFLILYMMFRRFTRNQNPTSLDESATSHPYVTRTSINRNYETTSEFTWLNVESQARIPNHGNTVYASRMRQNIISSTSSVLVKAGLQSQHAYGSGVWTDRTLRVGNVRPLHWTRHKTGVNPRWTSSTSKRYGQYDANWTAMVPGASRHSAVTVNRSGGSDRLHRNMHTATRSTSCMIALSNRVGDS